VAELAVERMARLGFEAAVDGVGNAVGAIGKGPLEAVLLGHIDTVPGEIPVRIEDGKLYGRGAVDAKGPFAAFIAGTARAFAADPHLPLRVVVVGCVEEEVPSSRGARFARDQYRPDFCIVGEPSGWDGITLGYKGFMRATMRLVGGSSHTAHQKHTMAERACATWESLRASTREFNAGRNGVFDQLFTRLVNIHTGTDGRYDWADLALNIRLPLDLAPDAAERWLREHVTEGDVTVQGHMPAWLGSRTTPLHGSLARAIRDEGGEPRYVKKTGTADLNIVAPAWQCPALAYGPGDAAYDHTPNEHIQVAEYLKGVSVLAGALRSCARRFDAELEREVGR
jgi:LysW-gamma-L-lysine carboxypeptidase